MIPAACLFVLQFYSDEDDYKYVLHLLLPNALEELTALTHLSLAGHDLPLCPERVAYTYLPALKRLDLEMNEGLTELPHGPWPALEELHIDSEVVLAALADAPAQPLGGAEAAGALGAGSAGAAEAYPALWGLTRLTRLNGLYGLTEEETEEKKPAIRGR